MKRVLLGLVWFVLLSLGLWLLASVILAMCMLSKLPANAAEGAMIQAASDWAAAHADTVQKIDLGALLLAAVLAVWGTAKGKLPGTRKWKKPRCERGLASHAAQWPGEAGVDVLRRRGQEAGTLRGTAREMERAYNLTAVRDPAEMVTKHLLDSLVLLPFVSGGPCGMWAPALAFPASRWPSPCRPCISPCWTATARRPVSSPMRSPHWRLSNVDGGAGAGRGLSPGTPFATVLSRAFSSLQDFARLAGPACASAGGSWP